MESSTFSALHIGATALIAALIALPVSYWSLRPRRWLNAGGISIVVAIATIGWRLPANMPQLNSDGVTGFRPTTFSHPLSPTFCLVSMRACADRTAQSSSTYSGPP